MNEKIIHAVRISNLISCRLQFSHYLVYYYQHLENQMFHCLVLLNLTLKHKHLIYQNFLTNNDQDVLMLYLIDLII